MSEIYAHRAYKVTFNVPAYNAIYSIVRDESGNFQYGNGRMVTVLKGDEVRELIDTRYDTLVMKDFDQWCNNYLSTAFRKSLEPKWEEVKGQPFFA